MHNAQCTHDLLLIREDSLVPPSSEQPAWVRSSVHAYPWVVVRRQSISEQGIPVGVRGSNREERWAGHVASSAIVQRVTPYSLRSLSAPQARANLLAFKALRFLQDALSSIGMEWGPIGSAGYELATGRPDVTLHSDLDIVFSAPTPIALQDAKDLCSLITRAPARIDVLIETPVCGLSLFEYAQNSSTLLLRTRNGRILAKDPWNLITKEAEHG